MLTTKAYVLAWLIHVLAAGGLILVVFRISRAWNPLALRIVIRTVAAVWLLMPAVVEPGAPKEWMAPALIVLALEWWESFDAATRVLQPLLVLTAIAVVVALCANWGWMHWRSARTASPEE